MTLSGVSFTTGATVSTPNEVLFNPSDNSYYKWTGSFAVGGKVVPPNSTPQSTGGIGPGKWLNVGDANLRGDINKAFNGSKVCFIEAWGDDSTAKIGSSIYPFKTIGAAISGSSGATTFRIGEGIFTWGGRYAII